LLWYVVHRMTGGIDDDAPLCVIQYMDMQSFSQTHTYNTHTTTTKRTEAASWSIQGSTAPAASASLLIVRVGCRM
jgi:hypothetical protein